MPAQLAFKARDAATCNVAEVLKQLEKLDGVLSVAKNDTAEGVSGFVVFENAELAAAARNRSDANTRDFVLEDPAREAPAGKQRGVSGGKKGGKAAASSHKNNNNFAADFFNGPSPSTMRDDRIRPPGGAGAAGGRGAGRGRGRGRGDSNRNLGNEEGSGRRRENNGAPGQRGGRGGRGGNGPRRPTVRAHVACVHNMPYNATNEQIFQAFKNTGHIFDIVRSERIALIYMAENDHVTNAIVEWNGKPFQGSALAICNGGEMRIPVPPPPPPPPAVGGIPPGAHPNGPPPPGVAHEFGGAPGVGPYALPVA